MPFTVGQFHLDTYATSYVLGYAGANPAEGLAERIFTTIPVDMATGRYKKIDKGDWYRDMVEERGLGAENKLAQFGSSDGVFLTREYGLRHRIDDRTRQNNNTPIDLKKMAGNFLASQHQIHKNGYLAAKFLQPGIWGTDIVGSATPTGAQVLQFDQSGSRPIQTIRKQRRAIHRTTGKRPNVLVLGADVYDVLIDHPDFAGKMPTTEMRIVNEGILSAVFEVDDVVVAESVYNATAEGLTPVMSYQVNSKCALLLYKAPLATTDGTAVTGGAIFPWRGLIPGTNADGLAILERRYDAAYSDEWDSRSAWDMALMAPDVGCFFTSLVS
jgi:hypothetical protein